jgi:hypothetical protein
MHLLAIVAEVEGGPGDTAVIPPGHDAWVVGDEPCIMIDFTGAMDYAKGSSGGSS